MSRAFITGALGFIGSALADRYRAGGWESTGVDLAAGPNGDIVSGDVSEPGPWQERARGADLVIHTAAIVSNAVGVDAQWKVNVVGTRRALDAARAAGTRRFVHFSSVRAFSDCGYPDGVDESWPVRPDGNAYVDTKIASEQVVLQAHAAGEVDCTIIRPADVYGPRSRPWTILPVEFLKSGKFLLPARGRGIFTPLFIDNLVDGVVLAASSDAASGQIFTLSDGSDVTCSEFFGHYTRMLGKGKPRTVPTPVALGLAYLVAAANRIRRVQSENNPTTVRYLARRGAYSIDKARRVLGYEPRVRLDEGMRRTEQWLRDQSLI